ncbi:MAG: BLUF domain-containing protein [Deltaproteobacteria bacterium]|nr:BLUF domain-containing protein [Myxococcales bacterium]MDP3220105.1 BLUF domain-containing protein [Deltaproteobacteria bacterium]
MSESTSSEEALAFMVYGSASVGQMDERALLDLLQQCRDNNARLGITGLLLHRNGNFLQVLEGPPDVIRSLYHRIRVDARHRGCFTLSEGTLSERMFPTWSMAFRRAAQLSDEDRAEVEGWMEEAPQVVGRHPARAVGTLLAVFQRIMR